MQKHYISIEVVRDFETMWSYKVIYNPSPDTVSLICSRCGGVLQSVRIK